MKKKARPNSLFLVILGVSLLAHIVALAYVKLPQIKEVGPLAIQMVMQKKKDPPKPRPRPPEPRPEPPRPQPKMEQRPVMRPKPQPPVTQTREPKPAPPQPLLPSEPRNETTMAPQAPEVAEVPPDAVPWGSPLGKQGGKPGGKGTEPITQPQPPPVKETVKPPEPKVDLDALWRDYAVKVISRIQSAKQYPPRAKRQGITGAVTVKFTVSRNGSVFGVVVSGSSGQPVLDTEARDAVTRAAPFPPIPGALNANSKTMSVTLKFEIR